jgi:cell division protein FtsL
MSGAKTSGITVADRPLVGMTLAVALMIAVCASSVAVVYSKHQSRKLFIELQRLSKERDELNFEWSRLQLEQSTYATHPRVEQVATEDLALVHPGHSDIFIISERGDFRFVGLELDAGSVADASDTAPAPEVRP